MIAPKTPGFLTIDTHAIVKNAPLAAGNGPYGTGDRCIFTLDSVG